MPENGIPKHIAFNRRCMRNLTTTKPDITNLRLYITSNNKTQGQQFDTAVLVRYTEQLSARYF